MPRRDIEFTASDGVILRGWFYNHASQSTRAPCIILTHGFTGVKEMDLELFAEYFTTHLPITALVYDNRCFGASDGTPRYEIIPALQCSDIQDAITFVQSLSEEVDPEKIAIWGSSYSGANVLQVAAFDKRVKVVLSQVPMISGIEARNRLVGSIKWPQFAPLFAADRAGRMKGEQPGMIPVITDDPHGISALPGLEAYQFFENARKTKAEAWVNQVTVKSIELLTHHNPGAFIHFISPTPLLLTVFTNDALTPADIALKAFNDAREPKQLQLLQGGHFDAYNGPTFETNVTTQTNFLKKWLL